MVILVHIIFGLLHLRCKEISFSEEVVQNISLMLSIWFSLIVITDEGRNPETGWIMFYKVSLTFS